MAAGGTVSSSPGRQVLSGTHTGLSYDPRAVTTGIQADPRADQQKKAQQQQKAAGKAGGGNLKQGAGALSGSGGYMGQVSGTANQLANFNPGLTGTANQLANFNPLQGAAGNTLQGILQTGNAVDTNPITQAAQIRAGQGFQDFMQGANEQFGALGLGSSSARQANLAREAGRLQQGIAATGMEAEVGAQENARQRQLQAFNPLLGGSGQQLAGLQASGGLLGQQAGMQLQGLQGAGQLQMGQAGLVSGERMQGSEAALRQQQMQAELNQQAAMQNQQLAFQKAQLEAQMRAQAAMSGGGGGSYSGGSSGGGGGTATAGYTNRFAGMYQDGGVIPGYASGGRVNERDFLSNLLYGVTFGGGGSGLKMPGLKNFDIDVPSFRRGIGSGGVSPTMSRADGMRNAMLEEQLEQMKRSAPSDRKDRLRESYNAQAMAAGLHAGPRSGVGHYLGGLESLANTIGAVGAPNAQRGLMHSWELMTRGGAGRPSMVDQEKMRSNEKFSAGLDATTQNTVNQYLMNAGINPLSGQRYQRGGEVDGPSVPPDVVPILAQGGELVVPVGLRHEIETSSSKDPLVGKLKSLINKPVAGDGMQGFAGGGDIPQKSKEFDPTASQPLDPVFDLISTIFGGGSEKALQGKAGRTFPGLDSEVKHGSGHHALNAMLGQRLLQPILGPERASEGVQRAGMVIEDLEGALLPQIFGSRGGLQDTLRDFIANQSGSLAQINGPEANKVATSLMNRSAEPTAALAQILGRDVGSEMESPAMRIPTQDLQALALESITRGVQPALTRQFERTYGELPEVQKPQGFHQGGQIPHMQSGGLLLQHLIPQLQQPQLPMSPAPEIPGAYNPEMGPSMPGVGFGQGQRSFSDVDLMRDNERGGFAAMTEVDPMRGLEDRFNSAKARVDLLSALATRAPAAARMKLAGLLDSAHFEMAEAEKPINAIRAAAIASDLRLQQDQALMDRTLVDNQGEMDKTLAQENARTEREKDAARKRHEAEVFASAGKSDAGFDATVANQAVNEYRKSIGMRSPEAIRALNESVAQMDAKHAGPQTREEAIAFLQSLRGKMTRQEVEAKYPDILKLAGVR